MKNWRDYILQHFTEPAHRLTLAADPDGLLLEEELLATIRQRGFDLLPFDDPVAFRYAYESGYRQHWDDNCPTDLVVILRSPQSSLQALPYDLLQSGRALQFSLAEIFPKLSYPVVSALNPAHLQSLYQAYQSYHGPEMGDKATGLFALKHIFGITPELVKTPVHLLKLLLSRHLQDETVPPALDALLLKSLTLNPVFANWPLPQLLTSAAEFYTFLQDRWPLFLNRRQPETAGIKETGVEYVAGALPFDHPEIRPHVQTLFLEGKLKPVSPPPNIAAPEWAGLGIERAAQGAALHRFTQLLSLMAKTLPATTAPYKTWQKFANSWAEALVLRYQLAKKIPSPAAQNFANLHLKVEKQFTGWMLDRYHTLPNQPYLPKPVMLHHVAGYMAHHLEQRPQSRLALLVVDGLALDQWHIIRDVWREQGLSWQIETEHLFAWVPTLTPIARQSLFAGKLPQHFPNSWSTTGYEEKQWRQFWAGQGLSGAAIAYKRNLGAAIAHTKDKRTGRDDTAFYFPEEVALEDDLLASLDDARVQVIGLVTNQVDKIGHGMQLGAAGMHQQIRLWLKNRPYLTQLVAQLLTANFTIFLTADHGNIWAQGIGRPSEGALVETRGQRARVYTEAAFLRAAQQQTEKAVAWTNVGLPEPLQVLLAPELSAFLTKGEQAVCHGGIALEEVIVPFAQINQM